MSDVDSSAFSPMLVDSRRAAEMLGVSTRTIWSLQACGELKPTRIGRSVRFAIAELQRFIAVRQEGGNDDAP